MLSTKRFRDNVHDYISVPKPIVDKIIDSELFQRLRWIEQTGMRGLYPSARHDRFIHSLGTYHLGCIAFDRLKENSDKVLIEHSFYQDLDDVWWDNYRFCFTIACLLHDCAHAPFSHTLEFVYSKLVIRAGDGDSNVQEKMKYISSTISSNLNPKLTSIAELDLHLAFLFNDDLFIKDLFTPHRSQRKEIEQTLEGMSGNSFFGCFEKDYDDTETVLVATGKEHERLSALMLATEMKESICEARSAICEAGRSEEINDCSPDFEFMVRAIIGCHYSDISTTEKQVKNALIRLLNSDLGFDVDGMDYIIRDTINSGFSNFSVDYNRILASLTLVKTNDIVELGFIHGSSEALQGLLKARNSLYKEIYSHHKVEYLSKFLRPELLKLAAKWLCCTKRRALNCQTKSTLRKTPCIVKVSAGRTGCFSLQKCYIISM